MKRPRGYMSNRTVSRVIAAATNTSQAYIRTISLTGWGEPLLHPDFDRMAAAIWEAGLDIRMPTNGLLIDRHLDTLATKFEEVSVSADGLGQTYRDIRGASFESLSRNVDLLLARRAATLVTRPKVRIICVVNRQTAPEVERVQSYWAKKGVDGVHFQRQVFFQREVQKERCWYPYSTLYIQWDGTATPCCVDYEGALAVGNINRQSLTKIWNSPRMRALRISVARKPTCQKCGEWQDDPRAAVPVPYRFQGDGTEQLMRRRGGDKP